jgi:hypothetical protein
MSASTVIVASTHGCSKFLRRLNADVNDREDGMKMSALFEEFIESRVYFSNI